MAESIARSLASDILEPSSAGLYPLGRLPEPTEQTLLSNGYSTEGLFSKPLRRDAMENAELIINMSGESLDDLFIPDGNPDPLLAQKVESWDIEDPYGADAATYQRILEELQTKIGFLAARLRSAQRTVTS
jgi:protein-tyrosine-phosphatase